MKLTPNYYEKIHVWNTPQLYALFLRPDGTERLSEEQLASEFAHILNTDLSRVPPVGVLTSQRRDHWAESRDILRKGKALKMR